MKRLIHKIIFCVSLLCFAFYTFQLKAGDSLRINPKFMMDISYSQKGLMRGDYNYDKTLPNLQSLYGGSKLSETYRLMPATSLFLNFNYLISPVKIKVNQFYIGLGVSYLNFNAKHTLQDDVDGKVSGTTIIYSIHDFNYQVNSLSIVPNISYQRLFGHFVFIQKLGVYCSKIKSGKSFEYEAYKYDWSYYDHYNNLVASETKKDQINENSFNLFYNIGFGFKIKHVMPFVNVELTRIGKLFNNPVLKCQIGASYLF